MRTPRLAAIVAFVGTLAFVSILPSALADTGPCAVPNGGPLPDLVVDPVLLANQVMVTEEKFSPTSCSVVEGFVSSPGPHTLLRFTSSTPNIGRGDLVIGDPALCPNLFELSACHGHYHFQQYADYRLWTPDGYAAWLEQRDLDSPTDSGANAVLLQEATKKRQLISGRKMGFCMIDSDPYLPGAGSTPKYTSCMTNQGLSAGWADRYDARLDGQWIEIDGLKDGDYVLENHVNAEHFLPETDFSDNSTAIRIRYTARHGANSPPSVIVLP